MKIISYIQEAYKELVYKVSWPTRSELQGSAIVVLVASLIFAVIVYIMDASLSNIMKFIYGIFY